MQTEHEIKLLIFDLDGTIFPTAPTISRAVNLLLRKHEKPEVGIETVKAHIGDGLISLIKQLQPEWALNEDFLSHITDEFFAYYREIFLEDAVPFPGLVEFLKAWKNELAIVSNKSEYFVRRMVEESVLNVFPWRAIYGGDSRPYKKPDPRSLLDVCHSVGVAPENTLMIGDGVPDIEAANNAGMRCLAVDFGYTPCSILMELGAVVRISSYKDLFDQLKHLTAAPTMSNP